MQLLSKLLTKLEQEQEQPADGHFFKSVLDAVRDGVYFVDRDRKITYWNKAAERLTGYPSEEVLGRHCYDNILVHVDGSGKQLCKNGCPLRAVLQDGEPREADVYLRHREGHRVPVAVRVAAVSREQKIQGAVEIFHDNTNFHLVRRRADKLQSEAFTDALTQLPNRRCMEESLAASLAANKRFGVLMCDIDFFKRVNDGHGHEVGDAVLKMTARTLHHAVRTNDLVGRWGGEEFLAILDLAEQESKLFEIAERCRMLVAASGVGDRESVQVTISIGATIARPGEGRSALIERADRLLYASKHGGRNRVSLETSNAD